MGSVVFRRIPYVLEHIMFHDARIIPKIFFEKLSAF